MVSAVALPASAALGFGHLDGTGRLLVIGAVLVLDTNASLSRLRLFGAIVA